MSKVRAVVRIRPPSDGKGGEGLFLHSEAQRGIINIHQPNAQAAQVADREFLFDAVAGENSSNNDLYVDHVERAILNASGGRNSTVICYGASHSGRKYSMYGEQGLVQQALFALFNTAAERASCNPPRKFQISLSVNENYCDVVRDLLTEGSGGKNLDVVEAEGKSEVRGLTIRPIDDIDSGLNCVGQAIELRHKLRSVDNMTMLYSVVTVTFHITLTDDMGSVCKAKLHLVDLPYPGSEPKVDAPPSKMKEFGVVTKVHATLSAAVSSLARDEDDTVPWRECKLARSLQDSLSTNAYCVFIAHVDPTVNSYEQNYATLVYGNRCRNSKAPPGTSSLHVPTDPKEAAKLVRKLQNELQQTKEQLTAAHEYFQRKLADAKAAAPVAVAAAEAPPAVPTPVAAQSGKRGKASEKDASAASADGDAASGDGSSRRASTVAGSGVQGAKLIRQDTQAANTAAANARSGADMTSFLTKQYGGEIRDLKGKLSKRSSELRELRESFQSVEQQLRGELETMRQKNTKLQEEMVAQRDEASEKLTATTNRYERQISQLEEDNKKLLGSMHETMDTLPGNFKATCDRLSQLEKQDSNAVAKAEAEFSVKLKEMHTTMETSLTQQKEQYEYWLEAKVQELRSFVKQYNTYKSAKQEELDTLEKQVVQILDYSQALARIIENYENGLYAVYEKSGIKVVQVNPKDKPVPLSEDLCRTIQKYQQRAMDFAEINRMAADTERDLVATESQSISDAAQNAGLNQATQQAMSADLEGMTLPEIRSVVQTLRTSVRSGGGTGAGGNWGMAREEDKMALEEEVLNDLADHPTIEYIRQLEDERVYYKDKLSEEVKAVRFLKISLDSKERQIQKLLNKGPMSGRSTTMSMRPGSTGSRAGTSQSGYRPTSMH